MKHLTEFLLIFFAVVSTTAQDGITNQTLIRNSAGLPVTSSTITITYEILDQNLAVEYSETQSVTTDANGLATAYVGIGTATTGTFVAINWSSGAHFIKVLNGTVDLGTTPFGAAPYAQVAKAAETIVNNNTTVNTISGFPEPYIVGVSTHTSDNLWVFNGETGWAAMNEACKATFPTTTGIRAFTISEIERAMVQKNWIAGNVPLISQIIFWTIGTQSFMSKHTHNTFNPVTTVRTGEAIYDSSSDGSRSSSGNGFSSHSNSAFRFGTTGVILLNSSISGSTLSGNRLEIRRDQSNTEVRPCMCGTYVWE